MVTLDTNDEAPLLAAENDDDHPQAEAATHGGVRVMLMDSARYCDSRNRGDVVVNASYGGTLPARLVAPHRPKAAVFHDVGIAADGSGINGLAYLEALGIPAATVEGASAALGDARDMYDHGRLSRVNVLAERCGALPGMPVAEAVERLALGDPGNVEAGTKVRRKVEGEPVDGHAIVVTDSIVFALPEDSANVLVTAGHTGSTGARFIEAVSPRGFICADGGTAKGGSGYAGLARLDEVGLPGACYDVMTAAMGDAYDAWDRGLISQANALARRRGVRPGQTVQDAARALLAGREEPAPTPGAADPPAGPPADHGSSASPLLRSGALAGISPKFAEGLARVREVTDRDGALPAHVKALFMAAAAAVKGHDAMLRREMRRAREGGLTLDEARGAAVAVLISRGEAVCERFAAAVDDAYGSPPQPVPPADPPAFTASAAGACDYFLSYFGAVPPYVKLMAAEAPRALEGYFLMREWSLGENLLEAKYVELLLCTVNAAEFSQRFVDVHAGGARRAGASEQELVEAVVCAIPVAGVASWLPGADGLAAGRGDRTG